jgi:hypothetical protein
MKIEFVTYEQALQLKELGFNEPCLFGYNQDDENKLLTAPQLSSYEINSGKNSDVTKINKVTAPFKAQVFKWFRDEHNLKFHIRQDNWNNWCSVWILISNEHERVRGYSTYEKAEDACLNKLIEIIKQK